MLHFHARTWPFPKPLGRKSTFFAVFNRRENVRLPKKEHEHMSCFWLPHNSADGCGVLYILQTFKTPFPEEHEGVRSVCLKTFLPTTLLLSRVPKYSDVLLKHKRRSRQTPCTHPRKLETIFHHHCWNVELCGCFALRLCKWVHTRPSTKITNSSKSSCNLLFISFKSLFSSVFC